MEKIFTCMAVIWFQHGNWHSPLFIHSCAFCLCACVSLQPKCTAVFVLMFWKCQEISFSLIEKNDAPYPKVKYFLCDYAWCNRSLHILMLFCMCFLVLIHKCLAFQTMPLADLSININLPPLSFFNTNILGTGIFPFFFFFFPSQHFCLIYGLWRTFCNPLL